MNNTKREYRPAAEPVKDYAMDRVRGRVILMLKNTLKEMGVSKPEIRLEFPPPGIDADLAFPCFPYARDLRRAPQKIAAELSEILSGVENSPLESCTTAGGYLNLKLVREPLFREIFNDYEKYRDDYGNSSRGRGKTIAIDYSSPNIAKPFSVGNIRSTIIGQAIYNLFTAMGYKVVGVNHLGDWGTQFGKLIYAYQQWGDKEKILKNPIRELLNLYVKFHKEAEKAGQESKEGDEDETSFNPLEVEARKRFRLLEEGDSEATALWEWFVKVSLEDFQRIYDRLGIKFDFIQGESFYRDKIDEVIKLVEKAGIGSRDEDGAFLIRLEDKGIDTPLLLQKSDGATLYATRELAELIYRTRTFKPEMLLYVVGSEQKLHFKQAFTVLKMLGFDTECHHVDFGMVSLKEGKMSTRQGRVIFFEDVMEEAHTRVQQLLEEKRPDLPRNEQLYIAEKVGIGAVKFNDLCQNRVKNVVFDWDRMLAFDGDTAPYLQYSYARVRSILRKADIAPAHLPGLLTDPREVELMMQLARFPQVVRDAADKFASQLVAQYMLETAKMFMKLYQEVQVLKAETPELTSARLGLIEFYSDVIRKGLWLLGIEVLERM